MFPVVTAPIIVALDPSAFVDLLNLAEMVPACPYFVLLYNATLNVQLALSKLP